MLLAVCRAAGAAAGAAVVEYHTYTFSPPFCFATQSVGRSLKPGMPSISLLILCIQVYSVWCMSAHRSSSRMHVYPLQIALGLYFSHPGCLQLLRNAVFIICMLHFYGFPFVVVLPLLVAVVFARTSSAAGVLSYTPLLPLLLLSSPYDE